MQVEIADDEATILVNALNMLLTVTPPVGLNAVQRMAMLAAKLIAIMPKPTKAEGGSNDGGQDEAQKQGTAEAVQEGKGTNRPEGEVAMPAHKGKHPMKKMPPKKHMMPKHHGKGKKK